MVKIYAVYSHYAKTTAKLSMHKFLQKLEICIFYKHKCTRKTTNKQSVVGHPLLSFFLYYAS